MKQIIAFLLGGILGVAIVRLVFLDEVERLAFQIFWESIGKSQTGFTGEQILQSATFLKSLAGFVLTGVLALAVTLKAGRSSQS